jgi:hypothetical protein
VTEYASAGDPDEILQWFKSNDLGDPRAIHYQKSNGLIKEFVKLGGAVPDNLFTVITRKRTIPSGNGHIRWLQARAGK